MDAQDEIKKLLEGMGPIGKNVVRLFDEGVEAAEGDALKRLQALMGPIIGEQQALAGDLKGGLMGLFAGKVAGAAKKAGGVATSPGMLTEAAGRATSAGTFSAAAVRAGGLAGHSIQVQQLNEAREANKKLERIQEALEELDLEFA